MNSKIPLNQQLGEYAKFDKNALFNSDKEISTNSGKIICFLDSNNSFDNYISDKNFEDKAYVKGIRQLLMNYETIINQKKERNRKKNS